MGKLSEEKQRAIQWLEASIPQLPKPERKPSIRQHKKKVAQLLRELGQ
ncbi:MAG: hypothetical protein KME29_31360 [Calothrix sp. FI2-JRJ7]|nr:hypothetical protein [Calothrix sp. FI2-JRJ7]